MTQNHIATILDRALVTSSIVTNIPKEFPIPLNTLWCQRSKWRFGRVTQIGTFIIYSCSGLNRGLHHSRNNPLLSKNQDELKIVFRSSSLLKAKSIWSLGNATIYKLPQSFYLNFSHLQMYSMFDLGPWSFFIKLSLHVFIVWLVTAQGIFSFNFPSFEAIALNRGPRSIFASWDNSSLHNFWFSILSPHSLIIAKRNHWSKGRWYNQKILMNSKVAEHALKHMK